MDFRYDDLKREATAIIGGEVVRVKAPREKARQFLEALRRRVNEDGLLYSTPHEGEPRARRR